MGGDGPFMLEKAIVRARWFRVGIPVLGKLRQCLNPSTTPNSCPCHTHTTVLLLETRGGAGRKILRKMCVCVCVGENQQTSWQHLPQLRHSGIQVFTIVGVGNVMPAQDDMRTLWKGIPIE